MDVDELFKLRADSFVRHLRVRGRSLTIITNSEQANALLDDTFYPPGMFDVWDAGTDVEGAPEITIFDVAVDGNDLDELVARISSTYVPGDYEITRDVRLPCYGCDGYSVHLLDDEPSIVVRRKDGIAIAGRAGATRSRWLSRLVRDTATRYAKADGSLILHSSAFARDGRAYLVVGDSGAGKSTLAVALARLLGESGWMGNDRIHVDRQDGVYRVTACPLTLAINKGTLEVLGIHDFATWTLHAGHPGPESDWDRFMGEDKLKLSSREVEAHLGVEVVSDAVLGGLIFSGVDLSAPYAVGPASIEQARAVLGRNCLSVDDNLYGDDWLGVAPAAPNPSGPLAEFVRYLANVPLLECSVGSRADVEQLAADFWRLMPRT